MIQLKNKFYHSSGGSFGSSLLLTQSDPATASDCAFSFNSKNNMLTRLKIKCYSSLFILLSLLSSSYCYASPLIDLKAVSLIESSGNPKAINRADNGGIGSYGLFQTSPYALADFNKAHKTHLKPSDLLLADTSRLVADWYINHEIPRLLRHYKQKTTISSVLTAYNMGINAVIHHKTATKYVAKYRRLTHV